MMFHGVMLLASLPVGTAATTHDLGGLQVEIGEPFVITRSDTGRCWFPQLNQINRKKLIVAFSMSPDEINPEAARCGTMLTVDGGRTWAEPVVRTDSRSTWVKMKDGTCVWTQYTLKLESPTVGSFDVARSRDGVNYTNSPATVDVSPHRFIQWQHGTASLVFCRTVLEMDRGSLLATMYGRFEGDAIDRSILVRSTDKGTTWRYFSTIGYDPTVGGEGLNEECMVRLANGSLLCLMRNESGKPMYRTRSTDGGETWARPERMAERYSSCSVFPDLVLMRNGILACSAGRPKCQLMFSLDPDGAEWTEPVTVFDGPSTCYTGIREVAPGTLLYVHDITPAGWDMPKPGQFHEIRGMFITVKRK